MIKTASISIVMAFSLAAFMISGCCDKSKCDKGKITIEEAIEVILAATGDSIPDCGLEGDQCPVSEGLPSADDAKTNLVARITLQLRAIALNMAELTERREKLLSDALENDTALASAYSEMVEARKRYDNLVGSMQSLQEIDAELVKLRALRGALLQQRAKFEQKAISKSTTKKESK